jgi:hypothetical protein
VTPNVTGNDGSRRKRFGAYTAKVRAGLALVYLFAIVLTLVGAINVVVPVILIVAYFIFAIASRTAAGRWLRP